MTRSRESRNVGTDHKSGQRLMNVWITEGSVIDTVPFSGRTERGQRVYVSTKAAKPKPQLHASKDVNVGIFIAFVR